MAFHSYPGQDFAMRDDSSIAAELKSSLLVHPSMLLSGIFWTALLACLILGSVNVTSFCAEVRDPLCAPEYSSRGMFSRAWVDARKPFE